MAKPIQPNTYTFRKLIEEGYLYVDKTQYIYDLVHQPFGVYFLSRPRRFGKSLLISTLEELFKGNRELFHGLWIDKSDYSWQSYPVIHIDFSLHPIHNAERLEKRIKRHLKLIAEDYDITLEDDDYDIQFEDLIRRMGAEKQVVILIDEYDKPLLDNIENLAEAKRIQRVMKGFYSVIKAMDRYIRFVMITGVSKFTRVTIFSEMNHLTELTMRATFGAALGLTERELRDNFGEHIARFAAKEELTEEEMLAKIRFWYNGFCFAPNAENVYNPFSTMQLFDAMQFDSYWFKSGTPTFLIKLIHAGQWDIKELNELKQPSDAFDSFAIERLSIVALLFQTGYLTIKEYEQEGMIYTLDFPNYEVKKAFLAHLLDMFSYLNQGFSKSHVWKMIHAIRTHDLGTFFVALQSFFADIDYNLHANNEK
ncbi:MAG: AAA family ATPase, partial [Chloroflexota bacterium]